MFARISIFIAATVLSQAATAQGEPARPPRPSSPADVERLETEVRQLRELLIQAMQVEQQHYDLLLKLIQSGAPRGAGPAGPMPGGNAPFAGPHDTRQSLPRVATVTGSVDLKGATTQPIFAYVDNLRVPPVRGRSIEIVQKDKQFSPQVSMVQLGTIVGFPNRDGVAHNVFSQSPRNTFDLGILKTNESGNGVVLREPGLVEVYCDIHEKMWAEVMVVPNGYFTRVSSDGRFSLAGVPTGERVIAVWTAGTQPVKRTVHVGSDGAEASFNIEVPAHRAHNNKRGQPYGSYGE